MDSWSDYFHRQATGHLTTLSEEQCLYDHLLECARVEPPEAMLVRFQSLFIKASGYSDQHVWRSIERILDSPFIEKDFKFILNRCCHILINHWLMQPRLHSDIPSLVSLLAAVPDSPGHHRATKRMRQLVRNFQQTEQYAALRRLAQVVGQPSDGALGYGSPPLGTLIRRYPCLYDHSLLTEDSTDEERKRVRRIRRQVQRQYDRDLARYATSKLQDSRLDPVLASSVITSSTPGNTTRGRSERNPTLLSDRRLDIALRQFGGKIDGSNTYHDLAQRFLTYSRYSPSYDQFKDDLFGYLTESIDPKYGQRQFNQRLYDYLQDTLPDHNSQQINDVLLVGTCRKLINFLVVENQEQPNHAVFVDLLGNVGASLTIGLLLKILLICRNVRPYLERQFAVLFKHYESCSKDGVLWLVESLEHLNVALSVNFGTLTLCAPGL
ncbi:hypothetical protein C7B76_25520 [filamentous cyanobacterium CCP2]|nr:hypothetical protein C7B76_25520 [filamentous cyanobacterium CCP2]